MSANGENGKPADDKPHRSLVERAAERLARQGGGQPSDAAPSPAPNVHAASQATLAPAKPPGTAAPAGAAGADLMEPPPRPGSEEPGSRRFTRNRVKLDMDALRAAGLVTSHSERSQIAEEFRLIKRPLLLKAFAEPPDAIENGNLIMVTSAKPGEGKTFCSVSLAMSIALERDLTVLLIDADVAKPDVLNVLGIEAEKGLVDLIADDDLDLSDVLIRTDLENLTILPAGRQHHLATELLASDKMDKFVTDIARRYPDRVIIIDSPPVLMSSVPGVLALHVGQTLFVVEAQSTMQQAVENALGLIASCKNINLLLNKAQPTGNSERFGAYYGYNR